MKKRTELILTIMHVLSWVVFIGIMIKAGAIIISYAVSIGNPEGAKNLYRGLNLFSLRQYDFWDYTRTVSLMVAMELFKAYIAFLVIRVLSKIKLSNPFTLEIAVMLDRISYYIFGTWILTLIFNLHLKWLSKSVAGLQENLLPDEFILLAGVLFVFSQIFRKGVEIQSENELTV